MDATIYKVPACNVEALREQIAELNKKAAKLGRPEIVLTQVGTEIEKRKNAAKIEIEFVYHLFTVEGSTPKLAGYTFVAVIEQLGEENLVKTVPGQTCPPEFRKTSYFCQHCNTDRRRKEVFVLLHDDGIYKQVGRNCLKDFLGGVSPEQVLSWAEIIFSLDSMCKESESEGWGGSRYSPNINEYLAVVAICIRRIGWISRKAAESMFPEPMTTAYLAWRVCCEANKRAMKELIDEKELFVEDRDLELAKAALNWAGTLPADGKDDYLYNLGVACRSGIVNGSTMGLIASVISAYQRHLDRVEELNIKGREKFLDEHTGVVGERTGFTGLTVKSLKYFEGQYGVKTLVRFKDAEGRTLIWWTGEVECLKEGETYDITGTVKEHGSHNGYKQTVLQRVKLGLPKAKKVSA